MVVKESRQIEVRMTDEKKFSRGLEGVIAAESNIGGIRENEGIYHYRHYNAVELNKKRSFEDVWFLMFNGHLPDKKEREEFTQGIFDDSLPMEVVEILPILARSGKNAAYLNWMRTATSALGAAYGCRPVTDADSEELQRDAMRMVIAFPVILWSLYRLSQGKQPVAPRPDLSYAQNYLYMINGEVADDSQNYAVERYLISTIDHGFNASTFTARVIASTGADIGASMVGAIGALSGPLHGGAPSRALAMLDAIGTPEKAEAWITDVVNKGERIMGFGHRVYKVEDPRSKLLREVAKGMGNPLVNLAIEVEEVATTTLAKLKPGRNLFTNVEYFGGVVMEGCGIPREMFTPTFACSRAVGWLSHILEQANDNRLFRPRSLYTGKELQPVPDNST